MEDPSTKPAVVDDLRKPKFKLPQNVKVSLLIFLLASSIVLLAIPNILKSSIDTPSVSVFLTAGIVMIFFTALLFAYLDQLKLGFGKMALILAFGYNAAVAVIKFVISPSGMYLANQRAPFSTQFLFSDQNTRTYYLIVGVLILGLYVFSFRLIYRHFVKRFQSQTMLKKADAPKRKNIIKRHPVTIAAVAIGLVATGGSIIFAPILIFGAPIAYIGYVVSALAIPLVISLVLAIVLAYKSFEAVEQQAVLTGNATILATFYWLGLSLIVLYHIMWVIFLLTLVQLWPFKTYTPK